MNMKTPWDQLTNELIREIAGEIEKDRRASEGTYRPEKPAPNPLGLPLPSKSGQGVENI